MRFWTSALLLTASCAAAADFTGTWTGVVQFDPASQPKAVCLSLWQGSGVTGRVTFDGQGDSADISSGRGEANHIEFQTQAGEQGALRFQLSGDERNLTGKVKLGDKTGTVSLTSYMPKGAANSFGPPSTRPTPLSHPQPEYTPEAKEAKLQGTVSLLVEILPSGAIGPNIRVAQSLGLGLDEKAIECARKWRFSPPRVDCKAVRTPAQIFINFLLR